MRYWWFSVMFLSSSMNAFFDMKLHQAHKAYNVKKYQLAKQTYEQKLINSPTDSQLNFNMADVLYRMNEFEQARDYFDRIAQGDSTFKNIKEQALFNEGNAHVKLKKLEDAIKNYEDALKINPDNEHAAHNRDIVKKMLEQQQQQEQQQDKKDSSDQKKKSEKGDQSEEQSDSEKNSNSDSECDQERNDKNKSDKKTENKSEQQQKPEQHKSNSFEQRGNKNSEEEQSTPQQQHEQSKEKNQKQTEQEQENAESQQKKSDNQKGESGGIDQADKRERHDPRTAYFLQQLDEHDKNQHKKLLRMQVDKGMRPHEGQKNW